MSTNCLDGHEQRYFGKPQCKIQKHAVHVPSLRISFPFGMFILHTEPKSLSRSHSLLRKYLNCLALQWFRLLPALHIVPEFHFAFVCLVQCVHENAKEVVADADNETKASETEHEDAEISHFYYLLSLLFSVKISNDEVVSYGNSAAVTVDVNSFGAATIAAVLKGLSRFLRAACIVLIVYAYLLKFGHKDTSILGMV